MYLNNLHILYVIRFYDIPLEGLCLHQGKIEKFIVDYDTLQATIIHLSTLQRFHYLLKKKLFELCVGNHWTYKDGQRNSIYYERQPTCLHKALFNIYYTLLARI